MDTQGYDLQVFAAAAKSLSTIVALQSEVSFKQIYDGMPPYLNSLHCDDAAGYPVAGLYPLTKDKSLAIIEIDLLTVKK